MRDLPCVLVPGGVTLPPTEGEDAGKVQTIGARFAHGEITLEEAAELGCRACASPGGGCQFLGTAATSQVVGEALGLSLPHSALAPSGQPIWLDMARRSARALVDARSARHHDARHPHRRRDAQRDGRARGVRRLDEPAAAHPGDRHAAGLRAADGRGLDARQPPGAAAGRRAAERPDRTIRRCSVFLAGGVPEVMLHLRALGLLDTSVLTVTGETLGAMLDWWEQSERRARLRELLRERDGVDPDDVIMSPDAARGARPDQHGHVSRAATSRPKARSSRARRSIRRVVDADGVYRKTGPARVFTTRARRDRRDQGQGRRRSSPAT